MIFGAIIVLPAMVAIFEFQHLIRRFLHMAKGECIVFGIKEAGGGGRGRW